MDECVYYSLYSARLSYQRNIVGGPYAADQLYVTQSTAFSDFTLTPSHKFDFSSSDLAQFCEVFSRNNLARPNLCRTLSEVDVVSLLE